jgi:hypothetical protein
MDLKLFPIQSYHKYNYYIEFFDDATSFGWIVLLKNKSEANTAIRQFNAMVKNQFNSGIKQVMIDARG